MANSAHGNPEVVSLPKYEDKVIHVYGDNPMQENLDFIVRCVRDEKFPETPMIFGIGVVYSPTYFLSFDMKSFDITGKITDPIKLVSPEVIIDNFLHEPIMSVGTQFCTHGRYGTTGEILDVSRQREVNKYIDELSTEHPELKCLLGVARL